MSHGLRSLIQHVNARKACDIPSETVAQCLIDPLFAQLASSDQVLAESELRGNRGRKGAARAVRGRS